jgi:hypothetical protein
MAGHGSDPAFDRANDPSRQVGSRHDEFTRQGLHTTAGTPVFGARRNTLNGPSSHFNPDASPAVNAAAAEADASVRSRRMTFGSA